MRARKLSIGPANMWSKTKIDCEGKRVKMEMLADVKTDTVGRQKKKWRPRASI